MSTPVSPRTAPAVNKKNVVRPANIAKALGIVVLLVYALFPFYWMLTTAVDTHANSRGAGILPTGFTLDHFKTVLVDARFFDYIKVSLIVAAGTVLLSGAIALFAAIGVARYRFRMRTVVLILVLMVQMVPLEALVIPLFLQARTLGMLNSLLGLVIVYLAFSLPFAIWNLKGFVAAVPKELEEAAYIDGAGWFRMFFSILLPLVAPGLVATSVFAFITAWNEFIFALTFMTDSSKYTVGVGLRTFFTQNTADWGPIMAASTIIALPVVVFFVLVQRQLSSGLTAGAVKG